MPAGKAGPALTVHWTVIHYRPVRIPPSLIQNQHKRHPQGVSFMLAEKEGFEPSNPFTGYTISSRAPSTKLGDFSITVGLRQRELL